MMVVHPSLPVNTLAEFVAYAKKEPLAYAHAGPGSGGHLAMEYFRTLAGFETVQVPYRGNAPLVIDLRRRTGESGLCLHRRRHPACARRQAERTCDFLDRTFAAGPGRADHGGSGLSGLSSSSPTSSCLPRRLPDAIADCWSAKSATR